MRYIIDLIILMKTHILLFSFHFLVFAYLFLLHFHQSLISPYDFQIHFHRSSVFFNFNEDLKIGFCSFLLDPAVAHFLELCNSFESPQCCVYSFTLSNFVLKVCFDFFLH